MPNYNDEGDKFSGEGIKKDIAYKTTLHYDELLNKRKEFFNYLGKTNSIKTLEAACRADHRNNKYILLI